MIIQPAHMSLKAMVLLPGMQAEGCHGISAVGLLLSLHYSLACPSKPVKWHMEQYKEGSADLLRRSTCWGCLRT